MILRPKEALQFHADMGDLTLKEIKNETMHTIEVDLKNGALTATIKEWNECEVMLGNKCSICSLPKFHEAPCI